MNHKLEAQKQEYISQLEQTVTRDRDDVEDLRQKKQSLEHQLHICQKNLEHSLQKQEQELRATFEAEKKKLEEKHKEEISNIEETLAQVFK